MKEVDTGQPNGLVSIQRHHARTSKNSHRSVVTLVYERTRKRYCPHCLDETRLRNWMKSKSFEESLCPICENKRRGLHRVRRPLMANGVDGSGTDDTESMELEEEEEEEILEGIPASKFMKDCIEDRFRPEKNPPVGIAEIGKSRIKGAGNGLFASVDLMGEDRSSLRVYGGEVMYTESESKASVSDKIMSFEIWDHLIHVDARQSWQGIMNHKGHWPYR